MGTIAGFVITGVVLVFGIAAHHKAGHPVPHASLLERATALLVLGLISCLLSAFALAAIGAERRLTPNLTAAALYGGLCAALGIVAIVAAFEALARAYLPQTQSLFALITCGTAVAASVLVALVLGDGWTAKGLSGKHWLSTPRKAAVWASIGAGFGLTLLGIATALYFGGVRIHPRRHSLHLIIAVGIILALLAGLGAMFRSTHAEDGRGRSILKVEAGLALTIMNFYLAVFLLMMP